LRESERRFRDVTEAASDWIWEMDENLRFTYLSERFFALTGIAPQHVLGRARWELAPLDLTIDHKNGVNTRKPWKSVCLFAILSTAPVSVTTLRSGPLPESQRQADL
jgi:PAS domain S-box-containing protein